MTQSVNGALDPATERTRRLRRGMGAALPARAAQAIAPLVVIPWLLDYLGVPLYGFWMATTAFMSMLSFSDLGLGNAVMSRLPPLLAEGKHSAARSLLSSSYALLALIATSLAFASGLLSWLVPLDALFGLGTNAGSRAVVRGVFVVTCLAFLANIPLGLIIRVQFARQRSGEAYAVATLAALMSMALTLLAVHNDIGPVLVVATNLLTPPLVNLVYTAVLFSTSLRQIRPSVKLFRLSSVRDALGGGLPFLALTVLLAVTTSIDYLLVGQLLGTAQVAEFSVPARLLAQIGALVSLMNMPFWSASAEALARRDLVWVDVARRRLSILGFVVSVLAVLLVVIAAEPLYEWWLGGTLPLSISLVGGLGVWWIVQASLSPTFMVQNGLAFLTPQMVGFAAYLALSIPIKLTAVPILGTASIGWISTGCLIVTVVPAALRGYTLAIRRLREEQVLPPKEQFLSQKGSTQ